MQNLQPFSLYSGDGTAVQVRNYDLSPSDELAECVITDDGRKVYCRDEKEGIFFFDDTREKLFLKNPAATQS